MGITGLIPFLENASTPVDVRDIQGSSVAVDSYCWLHKGVFGCAEKLARGEKTDIYVNYCLKYVDMLTKHKIKVIMVFDGRHLPAKAETERRRREARQESKKLAKEYLRMNDIEKARSHMRRSIDVTHEMALELIKACRERGVECIVAPYEADAQMAWLNKAGLAEYIITEDSDLTLFGAEKVLFKLDLNGYALLVEKTKLYLAMGCKPEKYTFDKFRRMCILSGCDYLDSLPGIGLKKACKFMLTTEEDDMTKALKKLPLYLKMKQLNVTDEYVQQFLKAEATFKHMFVYNPLRRRMERLCDLEEFQTEEKYCTNAGTLMDDQEQAFQLALGNLNPFSLKQLDDWHPAKEWTNADSKKKKSTKHKSIWSIQASEQCKDNKTNENKGFETIFKKIEYKNMAEVEIQENLARERLKLEEAEVFSMYNISRISSKRKRMSTESGDDDDEERKESCQAEEIKTPSKSVNPFAVSSSCGEIKSKSQVCTNNSLLKILSPHKDSGMLTRQMNAAKIDVKSRFFSQNIKSVVKKPFVARDLTGEMIKIEEKNVKCLEIQRSLYLDLSPQSYRDKSNEKNVDNDIVKTNDDVTSEKEKDLEENPVTQQLNNSLEKCTLPHTPSAEANEPVLILSDEEDEDKSSSVSSQKSTNSSLVSGPRRLGLSKPKSKGKSTKKIAVIDSKQPKLSRFGFQKQPSLKKI